ncbi:MAG: carboxypeptidase-like regulatory domain-containing protein, partial [Armatimonadota bacterium]
IAVADALLILRAAVGLIQLPSTMPGGQERPPVLGPLIQMLEITGPQAKTFTLPDALWVTGRVLDASNKPVAFAEVEFSLMDGFPHSFNATTDANGAYKVAVLPGAYRASVTFSPVGVPSVEFEYTAPDSMQVTKDTVKDFTLPQVPRLFNVAGKVQVSNTGFVPISLLLEQTDEQPLTAAVSTPVSPDGSFKVGVPAGSYSVNVGIFSGTLGPWFPGGEGTGDEDTGDGGEEIPPLPPGLPNIPGLPTVPEIPSIPVVGSQWVKPLQIMFADLHVDLPQPLAVSGDTTANLVVPKLVKLSGKGILPQGVPQNAQAVVAAIPVKEGQEPFLAPAGYSMQGLVINGQYLHWLVPGSYSISTEIMVGSEALATSLWSLFKEKLEVAEDTVLDVTFPQFSVPEPTAQLDGTVVDARGSAVVGAEVTLSTALPQTMPPTAPRTMVTAMAKTGSGGKFAVKLPPGVYMVVIQPPASESKG